VTEQATAQIGGYRVPPLAELSRTVTRGHRPDACGDSGRGLRDRLPGWEFEYFGMGPAVVLGQDLSEGSGPVGDGPVTDLAAGDRKLGNGHREAAGK
jgi:hypothetical protein